MAILSASQARSYAASAGFAGNAMNIIVAIAMAESSLNTDAKHTNSDESIDRGLLQINSRWHPEVSDSCAYDPACAMRAGYTISSKGSNFSAWATYTSGVYLRYLSGGGSAAGNLPGSGTTTSAKPWYKYPVTHGYYNNFVAGVGDTPHWAIDYATPMDTPLSFLESGTIVKADYQLWGGEVFLRPDKGGPEEYHYHLDEIDVKVGQHVQAGQRIGLSGGQTSGGQHPTDPSQSTGPHDHFGLFVDYRDTPIGTRPYGPDPSGLIASAGGTPSYVTDTSTSISTSTSGKTFETVSQRTNEILAEMPGFGGLARVLDMAEQFPGIINHMPEAPQISTGNAGLDGLFNGISGLAATALDPQDYVGGAFLTAIDTAWSNFLPLVFRSVMVIIGLFLIIGLLYKAVDSTGLIDAAAMAGKMAA